MLYTSIKVLEELTSYKVAEPTALTIGVFDGVHLGHRHLIKRVKEIGRQFGLESGVVTFDRHPQEVLRPENPFFYLTPGEQRLKMLEELKVKLFVISFTRELSQLGAKEFLTKLVELLKMKFLVCGPDFRFGRNREGDLETISLLAKELRFNIEVFPFYKVDGEIISSTAIKKALSQGDIEKANRFLGRPFTICGKVISGRGVGKGLGFPTVNLEWHPKLMLPANGVYAARACLDKQTFPAALYIGTRPTFQGQEKTIEAYLLGIERELYGQEIALQLITRIREERKFNSLEELKEQIEKDICRVKEIVSV